MDEFTELLNDLDIAVEAANTSIKKDFKAASKTANKALKMAKSAMKAHKYEEAIKYCDEGIDALHNFKKLVKESGADKDAVKSSHAIAAGANCVKVVLGLMLAAAAVFISAKAVKAKTSQKRRKTDDTMLGVANSVADAANSKLENVNKKNEFIDHKLTSMSDELDLLSNAISDAQMSASSSKGHARAINYKTQKLKSGVDKDYDSARQEYVGRADEPDKLKAQIKSSIDPTIKSMYMQLSGEPGEKDYERIYTDSRFSNMPNIDKYNELQQEIGRNAEYNKNLVKAAARNRALMRKADIKISTARKRLNDLSDISMINNRTVSDLNEITDNLDKANHYRNKINISQTMLKDSISAADTHPINGSDFVSPSEEGIPEKLAGKILSASKKKTAAGAISAGVVTALVTYLKGIKSGKNANVASMLKAVDVSIKALNTVKSQCQELLRDNMANESIAEDDFVITEESAMMIDYSMTLTDIVFSGDSVMESFIEMGFDDIEACELYMDLLSIV